MPLATSARAAASAPASASISASAAAITDASRRRVRLELRALLVARADLTVERFARFHHLELAILEIAAVPLQHVDVGLHRLQLARRADGAGVELPVGIGGARADGLCFVVEPPLFGPYTLAALPEIGELGVEHRELAAADVELGPLGRARRAGAEGDRERDRVPGRRGVVRVLPRSSHPPAGGGLAGTAAGRCVRIRRRRDRRIGAGDDGSRVSSSSSAPCSAAAPVRRNRASRSGRTRRSSAHPATGSHRAR